MKLYKRHTRILAITNADDTRWGFRHAHLKTIDGERYLCATNGKMAVCVAVECEACDIDGVIHRMAIQCADLAIQDICRQEDEDGEEELFEGPVNMISRADGAFFDGALFPIPDVKPLDIAAVLPKRGDQCIRISADLLRNLVDCATEDVIHFYPGKTYEPIRIEFSKRGDQQDDFGVIMPIVLREA